ncbi:uncharacterized protein LY89DRAFT_272095 [Mollisia scopiformis]|uniref:C2H2-type domain-containing protein n=1 Tax=Mollisia scopiformis TaxID=149040 RepID=A0A132BCT9_MOLSC|nr:uncharacterized protein LY89DRAFT_272095 [Mollisia scopiformis]KUJ10198.1 hypothetical protein LY89DRAFT_272095 [Mollisia scopiformis]
MAKEPDPATGSLLYFLVKLNLSGPEGIAVSELFSKWTTSEEEREEVNAIWKALAAQGDVLWVDGEEPLSQSPLTKHSYDELVAARLGSKKIRLRDPRWDFPSEVPVGKLPWPPILDTEAGRCATHIACHSDIWARYPQWAIIARQPTPIPGWNSWNLAASALSPGRSDAPPETPRRRTARTRLKSGSSSTLRTRRHRDDDERPIREALYTSYEEMQRQEGTSGVYMGLPGTENTQGHSKAKSSLVAVFKHPKLKDDTHLSSGRGSWAPYVAEILQKDLEHVKKTTKRPKRNQSGRKYTKRQKKDVAPDASSPPPSEVPALEHNSTPRVPSRTTNSGTDAFEMDAGALPSNGVASVAVSSQPLGAPNASSFLAPVQQMPQLQQMPGSSAPQPQYRHIDPYSHPIQQNHSDTPQFPPAMEPTQSSPLPATGQLPLGGAAPTQRRSRRTSRQSRQSQSLPSSRSASQPAVPPWPPTTSNQWPQANASTYNSPYQAEHGTAPTAPRPDWPSPSAVPPRHQDHTQQSMARHDNVDYSTGYASLGYTVPPPHNHSLLDRISNLGRATTSYSSPYVTSTKPKPSVNEPPSVKTSFQPIFSAVTPQQSGQNVNLPQDVAANKGNSLGFRDIPAKSITRTTPQPNSRASTPSSAINPNSPAVYQSLNEYFRSREGSHRGASEPIREHRRSSQNNIVQQASSAILNASPALLAGSTQARSHSSHYQQHTKESGSIEVPQEQYHAGPPSPIRSTVSAAADRLQTLLSSNLGQLEEPRDAHIQGGDTDFTPQPLTSTVIALVPSKTSGPNPIYTKSNRSRKRKLSANPTLEDNHEAPKAKTRKRKSSQAPNQAALEQSPVIDVQEPARELTASEEIEELLRAASEQAIPGDQARLPCIFTRYAGNLLLLKDFSTLEFFWTGQNPPQPPLVTIPVLQIAENPITSIRGSKPMQLRVTLKNEDDEEPVIHNFIYGKSAVSSRAATQMREKIVIAMGAERLRTGGNYQRPIEAKEKITKPYLCTLCNARFKNPNGLQYHLTKSNTTCNPGFDPASAKKPRGGRVAPPKEAMEPTPRATRNAKATAKETVDSDAAESSHASESSDDSILEWARKAAGVESPRSTSRATRKAKPTRVYKALNRETEVLGEILASISENLDQDVETPALPAPFPSELPSLSRVASQISSTDELTETVAREMVRALIHANNDVFPGQKSVWMGCVALWLKMHPQTDVLPRSTLCSRVIDDLMDDKKLESTDFTFIDHKSRLVTRNLIYIYGADISGPRTEMLKTSMQEIHPKFFIPSHLAPPPLVLDALQALANRQLARRPVQEEKLAEAGNDDNDLVIFDSASPDSFPEGDLSDSNRSNQGKFATDEDDESESGSEFEMGRRNNTRAVNSRQRRARNSRPPSDKRYRSPTTNARISESLKNRWKDIKAGKLEYPDYSSRRPSGRSRLWGEPIVGQSPSQTWPGANAYLPNSVTGAWDRSTAPKPKPGPKDGKMPFTPRPAEPITFLQAMDGSWSVKPFGHGVKPIYCRPNRRAHGGPNLPSYLKRIEDGHRPIIYPTKDGIYLPTPPSKVTTKQLVQNLSVDIAPMTNPKRRHTRRVNVSMMPPDLPEYLSEDDSASDFEEPTDFVDLASSLRPKRRYTRRSSNIENDKVVYVNDMEWDADIVVLEPKKMQKDAPPNPGLDTIPPRFGLPASMYKGPDLQSIDFPTKYFSVMYTEQKYMGEDMDGPKECSWTLRKLQSTRDLYQVQWVDDFAFTSESIPYHELEADGQVLPIAQPGQVEALLRKRRAKTTLPRKKSHKQITFKPVAGRPSLKERIAWTRSQLAITSDFTTVFRDPKKVSSKFHIEIVEPNKASQKRQRHVPSNMSPADENRFIVAVVVQRILTGGLDLLSDWVLIGTIFQDYTLNFLAEYWKRICEGKEAVIDQLGRDFQAAYPAAYKKGVVPPFDWNDLASNDWDGLISWVQDNVVSVFGLEDAAIPDSREELEEEFDMLESVVEQNWRNMYFAPGSMKYKRIELSSTEPLVTSITKEVSGKDSDETLRSYVRATALTPELDWPVAKLSAREKLASFDEESVERVISSLIASKVLMHRNKGRAVPGRGFEGTDAFYANLRKHMKEPLFIEAITYKRWMDAEFRSGTPCLLVDYMANEGSILVLASLQALGRIRIDLQNLPMEKFGLTESGYETKSIPREKITFDMTITPTPSYLYDEQNEILQSFFELSPPKDEEEGRIPIWYGISGILIPDIWKKVLVAFAQTVALRTGINLDGLTKVFRPTLGKWEVKILMQWGVRARIFECVNENVEGWTVNEWWWALVGRMCTT